MILLIIVPFLTAGLTLGAIATREWPYAIYTGFLTALFALIDCLLASHI